MAHQINKEVELHEKLHRSSSAICPTYLANKPRLKLLPYAENVIGRKIGGKVIDIGAGNGYAGIWLAKNRTTSVVSLECTHEAVSSIIPESARLSGVQNAVHPELGSFDDLGHYSDHFDFAICFGVLHHAQNLLSALDSIYDTIRPGGYLLAQEPYTSKPVQNSVYREVYNSKEFFAGEMIRHGDRNDCFYRHCEYLTAAYHSDFEVLLDEDVSKLLEPKFLLTQLKLQIQGRWHKIKGPVSDEKLFAKYRKLTLMPRNLFLILRKPLEESSYIPHRWG